MMSGQAEMEIDVKVKLRNIVRHCYHTRYIDPMRRSI